jgi:hypothetical protein
MKTLEEKKLLVKMARAFGQPVDPALLESIEREERLAKILFKEEKKPEPEPIKIFKEEPQVLEPQVLIEAEPYSEPVPPPAPPAFEVPPKEELIQQVVNFLGPSKSANTANNVYRDKEIEGIRRTLAEMMQKIGTLSWGGGGTGIVRIWDADDLDRSSAQNGRFMKYQNGMFVLDEINPFEIVHNTTIVTTPTYVVQDTDYYIGVNRAGPVTILIPSAPTSGRELVIKDESGNCEIHNITVSGTVDNDVGGFILAVNNGAVHMLYRGDSWRII